MTIRIRLLAALAGTAIASACARNASNPAPRSSGAADTAAASDAAGAGGSEAGRPDSLLLERIAGFTRRPGYRVSVAATGRVDFAWLAPGDSARPARDSIAPALAAELLAAGAAAGVGRLPENIREHADICGRMATDHATAVVTLFYPGGRTARVSDYLGCRDAVPALRAYEARVDSVAGTARWTATP